MPITERILDHKLFGPKIREGIAIGREEGRQEGERDLLNRLIAKRFGPVPTWAKDRLDTISPAQLEDLALRLLDAQSIEELFK